jgi:hypothetical protein
MKRNLLLSILLIYFAIFHFCGGAFANEDQLDQNLRKYGYIKVSEAVKRYESYSNLKVVLPAKVPSLSFTHVYGRFDRNLNDYLEIRFINKEHPRIHYMIHIVPKTAIDDFGNEKTYNLNDGTKARYITKRINGFNLLIFSKNELKYVLSVDKRVGKSITVEKLIEIANSVKEKTSRQSKWLRI